MSEIAFLKTLVSAKRRDRRFGLDEFNRVQRERLVRLIAHARSRVPLHADRLSDVNPHTCHLRDLPTIDKQTMMERFDETISDRAVTLREVEPFTEDHRAGVPWLNGRYLISKTSGTTGDAAWFLNDGRTWAIQRGAVMARNIRDRLTPKRAR